MPLAIATPIVVWNSKSHAAKNQANTILFHMVPSQGCWGVAGRGVDCDRDCVGITQAGTFVVVRVWRS